MENVVTTLVDKAHTSNTADEALKWSQVACNVALAMRTVAEAHTLARKTPNA